MGRRRSTSVIDLLSEIADDIKDFLDDEALDRGRDTERDLRRAGGRWTDSDDHGRTPSANGRDRRDDDLDELRAAIRALASKVDQLASEGVTTGVESLREEEPWAGYDGQTVAQIRKALGNASDDLTRQVRAYESRHKKRQGVLNAATTS